MQTDIKYLPQGSEITEDEKKILASWKEQRVYVDEGDGWLDVEISGVLIDFQDDVITIETSDEIVRFYVYDLVHIQLMEDGDNQ